MVSSEIISGSRCKTLWGPYVCPHKVNSPHNVDIHTYIFYLLEQVSEWQHEAYVDLLYYTKLKC